MDFNKIKNGTDQGVSSSFTGNIFNEMLKKDEPQQEPTVVIDNDPQENLVVLKIPKHKFEPIRFDRIVDKYGTIKQKVMKSESILGLSCIPFDMIKISNSVEEIQDYRIIVLKGRKYAASVNRLVNEDTLDRFIARWKDIIMSGEDIEESLVGKIATPSGEVETCYFNIAEMEKIIDLFCEVGGEITFSPNDIVFTTGR